MAFGLGLVFADFCNIKHKIAVQHHYFKDDIEYEVFRYIWIAVSFFHDYGYLVSRKKYGDIDDINKIKVDYNIFKSSAKSRYDKSLYIQYYKEMYKKNKGSIEIGDHGVLGGYLLYDIINRYENTPYSADDICYRIMEHNIWKKDKDYSHDNPYFQIGKTSFEKIGIDESLLFLLSIVDTVEPTKKYSKYKDVEANNYKYIYPKTIADKILCNVDENKIEIDVSQVANEIKNRNKDLKINDWIESVYKMQEWIKVEIEYNKKVAPYKIIIKK